MAQPQPQHPRRAVERQIKKGGEAAIPVALHLGFRGAVDQHRHGGTRFGPARHQRLAGGIGAHQIEAGRVWQRQRRVGVGARFGPCGGKHL